MALIPVRYLCWGCKGETVKHEEQKEPIPSKVAWNLCKECQNKIVSGVKGNGN